MSGVELILYHPKVAYRSCQSCQEYLYDEDTGQVSIDRKFATPRAEKRPAVMPPPCRTCIGCPKGTPENSRELSPKNRLAYEHYLQCRAVGDFPKHDAIVRRNAAIILGVYDGYQRFADTSLREWIKVLASRPSL